jgi:hypothetical protein
MKCSVRNCDGEAVSGLHTVRGNLVESLAAAIGYDSADAVVDALDAYLAEPDRGAPFQYSLEYLKSNPRAELDKTIQERDKAVARAEKAERELAKNRRGHK